MEAGRLLTARASRPDGPEKRVARNQRMTPQPLPPAFSGLWKERAQAIRVAALDMDGTLLTDQGEVSARTQAMLQAWTAAGRQIVLATGRAPRQVRRTAAILPDAVLICYNGAWIESHGQTVFRHRFSLADTRAFLNRVLSRYPALAIGLEADDTLYVSRALYSRIRSQFKCTVCDPRALRQPAIKIILVPSCLEPEQRRWVKASLPPRSAWLEHAQYDLIQIGAPGTDKAMALARWLQTQSLSFDHVAAVGDDVNDVDMIARARLGVAMGNAVPEARRVADFVTADNQADGVARVLESVLAAVARQVA